jgi:hypothetical protein
MRDKVLRIDLFRNGMGFPPFKHPLPRLAHPKRGRGQPYRLKSPAIYGITFFLERQINVYSIPDFPFAP